MINLVSLETCASTNDEAWKRLPKTTLVVTKRQTQGRGRQGRHWEDDQGNLMASLGIVPDPALIKCALWIPLAAGVAAAEAIESVVKHRPSGLRLKWPNDVYWENSKMGGLLCESRVAGEQLSGLVIGFGLNILHSPNIADLKVTNLKEHVPDLVEDARARILNYWADRMLSWLEELTQGRHDALRKKWLENAKLKKFPNLISHDRDGNSIKLQALDLDESGKLKAEIDSKIVYLDQPVG